jgi:hypothetical protein
MVMTFPFVGRCSAGHPGIGDHDVEAFEALGRRRNCAVDLGPVGDITGHRNRRSAQGPDRVGDLFEALHVSRGHRDIGACLGQSDGDGAADASAATGHQRRLAAQVEGDGHGVRVGNR